MDFVSDEQRKAVFASMRDRGDLIYNSGSYYSRRNKPCTYGKYSYKRYPEYHLYTEGHLKILLDAQISLRKQISTLEKQSIDWQNVANWLSIMRLSSLKEQLAIINAEIKAIEAQGVRVKSTTFVSDEQRKAVFASMRDRGVIIEYGKSSYTSSSKGKFKNRGSLRVSKVTYRTVCSDCGAETQVPFKPDHHRPVYCMDCLLSNRKPKKVKTETKASEAQEIKVKSSAFVSDEQRKAVFASMRDRGDLIEYGRSSYIGSSEGKFKKCGISKIPKVMHKAVCSDCGAETQVSFKPDPDKPIYCIKCFPKHRKPKKKSKGESKNCEGFGSLRKMHKAVCSYCGAETQVPFKPDHKRPVYCRKCLPKHRKPREKS